MPLDILTIGEALVEVMRTDIDQPLDQPGPFSGPYPSGAPFIFAVQAARLGMCSGAIGSVGKDAFGECLLNQLDAGRRSDRRRPPIARPDDRYRIRLLSSRWLAQFRLQLGRGRSHHN